MKKCPVCGHIMEDEARFCSACGNSMPEVEIESESPITGECPDEDGYVDRKSKLKRQLIIIGVVIALLLLPSAVRALDLSWTMLTLKSKITNYCAEQCPGLPIRNIQINTTKNQDRKVTKVDVTLTMDCSLTENQYDKIYDNLFAHIFLSPLEIRWVQITPLKIIDDSGKDYRSGYWDRQRAAATPSPTPSSQSNPGVSEEDAKWAVYLMAEEKIPDYLNCPSTMEICLFKECDIRDVGFNIWKGEGYFEAENLYGATVRSKWNITCTIKDGKIRMNKLKIDDIVVYNDGTQ